ncbi:MAG: TonB-dependent receptor [Gammaproteobacteria bacterium]|jgi:iron complex outermembrane receptor protein|nr:TonB-dependent receptor [Gammaproteobacteria bacterium]
MVRSIDEELLRPRSAPGSRPARRSVAGLCGALVVLSVSSPVVWGDPPAATGAAGGPPATGVTRAPGDAAAGGEEKGEEKLEELVIVGSRFVTAKTSTVSPVVTVDASEFSHQGTARAEDLLNSLPQLNAGLTESANGAGVAPITGTATADLRGIGSFNTLVLMNGRRLQPGDSINPSPDLNAIPTALVKRVEVLTGGASSIYGSDAISGVVNFVIDSYYTGAKLETEYGLNRASNNNRFAQDIERANGVNPRSGATFDGHNLNLSGVFGKDLFDGDGHVVAYAGYRRTPAIFASSRDFSACTLTETATSYRCQLDGTTPAGQFVPDGGNGNPLTLDSATGNSFRPFDIAQDGYNPAPFQTLARPDTRYNAGFFGHYKIRPTTDAYVEATFSDDRTSVMYEPPGTTATGAGLNTYGINCNNPLLSASEIDSLCTQYGLGATDTAQVQIGRRNIEGGFREDVFRHRTYRLLLGLKGDLNSAWTYDINGQWGNTDSHERVSNDISNTRLTNALNVVNVNGAPTCQSVVDGSDPSCVPYNIFTAGAVTQGALNYIRADGGQDGYARQYDFSGQVVGDLGKYGFKSPYTDDGIGLSAGVEFRSQSISNQPNAAYLTGDLLQTGGARQTLGTYRVSEVFAEMRVPLIEERPFAKSLTLSLSDRLAKYTPQGMANAYNFGLEWAPDEVIRLRGSLSRAVRAPNGHELFLSQIVQQFGFSDPCANDPTTGIPVATQAQCARTGVTAAQYGKIAAATGTNVLTGGNPNLKPQIADTVTAGIVLTPRSLARTLLISVDYWRIRINKYIGSLPANATLNNCLDGNTFYCPLIQRDANGSLSVGTGDAAGRIIATGLNTGSYEESGVDIDGNYVLNLASAGSLSFAFAGSVALDNVITTVPGLPAVDCTGYYGATCTGEGPTSPIPTWRHKLRTTWQLPNGFEASLNWRHIGHLKSEQLSPNPQLATGTAYPIDATVPAYDYFDLDVGFDLGSHVSVRLGVDNLLDKQPPLVGFNLNPLLVNGNMLASMYDTYGRYLFVGLTAKY